MADSGWSNQLISLIVLSASQHGFSGFFVYSPAPGPGNLIGSWAAAAGTDQFGNAYPAGLSVELGSFTGSNLFLYNGTPAAGNLLASVAAASGTDAFGNHWLQGIASYSSGFANSLIGGALIWYSGTLAGGWTFLGQLEASGSALIVDFSDFQVTGTMEVTGNTVLTGTLSVNGSGSTAVPVPNATSNNGLANGTITGTSGAASAGTAHTHGAGSFAVTDGHHSHDTQNHTHVL